MEGQCLPISLPREEKFYPRPRRAHRIPAAFETERKQSMNKPSNSGSPAGETRHCHHCGAEYAMARNPGRSETCHQCSWDLRVCLNCLFYDRTVAYQCRERRADPVVEKHLANYCEYFEMPKRPYVPEAEENHWEAAARSGLKKLLGD